MVYIQRKEQLKCLKKLGLFVTGGFMLYIMKKRAVISAAHFLVISSDSFIAKGTKQTTTRFTGGYDLFL